MNKTKKKVCAVIPAAGEGRRLGGVLPKILVPVTGQKSIWDFLYEKISPLVDHTHVVLSPIGQPLFQKTLTAKGKDCFVTTSVQHRPIGMGDAIFGAYEFWKDFEYILIVWGDQIYVSSQTLQTTIKKQIQNVSKVLTLPVNEVDQPYVQYIFNDNFSCLTFIRQTREGDVCDPKGLADVGVFALSTTGLKEDWEGYLKKAHRGKETKEVNFLPFLTYLSSEANWKLNIVQVKDPDESRGINTTEDLDFFRKKLASLK